ncbi:AI-2E family transporter [bacterium]|nr:AI-2E family transporter [bacterium]
MEKGSGHTNHTADINRSGRLPVNVALYFLLFLLIIVLWVCYHIIKPYVNTIILAMILASTLSPLHRRILSWVKGRKNLAAFITCHFLTLVVIIPIVFMLFAVIQQGIQSFNAISEWIASGKLDELLKSERVVESQAWLETKLPWVQKFFPSFELEQVRVDKILLDTTRTIGKTLVNQGGHLLGNITALIAKFFLMIFVFYFIIRDEEVIINTILHYSPLSNSQEERIIAKVKDVAKSALVGTFVTAIAQGTAGCIAFWICGLPGLFWGMVMAFASLIPVVGTALVWVPAATYLFLSGHWGYGIFLTLWCMIIVGLIDNLVRPLFMTGSAGMSTVLIFFSIVGGIGYFGLLGVLYGPLLFGLAMVLFYIYRIEFEDFLDQQDKL